MAANKRKSNPSTQATFVFKGTVQALKSATMKQVPVDDRTVVASVDQIVEAPPNLAKLTGQKVTVQLSGRKKVKRGEQMIFHAISWIYGDSIALRSLSEEAVKPAHMTMLAAAQDPVAQHHQRVKEDRFKQADLVVSGKVVAVRLPEEPESNVKTTFLAQPTSKPVSEHDPKWREAVVEIDDVHKGAHQKKQVVVRFPASKDVMWYHSPKFQPGQQGFFMLHKAQGGGESKSTGKSTKKAAPGLIAQEGREPDVYTAPDAADFQPFNEGSEMPAIIESAVKEKRKVAPRRKRKTTRR